jgi:4-hydroxy-tetrahydrodipicolinate synthase
MTNNPEHRLKGVLAPVLTPFTADLAPDVHRFVQHCQWLLSQGVGLAMFGTNSEGNSMSLAEKCGLLDALIAAGIPMDRAMPGTGSCSLTDAVVMTSASVQAGSAGALVLPPFYYKGTGDDGLFRFFAELIERVGDTRLRVYLYHIPAVSGVGITPELVERLLAAYPQQVAGMKDTGGDWTYTAMMLKRFSHRGFDVFAGTETVLLDALRAGGPGCITATANVSPSQIVALYDGFLAGIPGAQAEALQAGLNVSRSVFAQWPLIASMKTSVAHFRGDPSWRTLRPPLTKLEDEQANLLITQLEDAGFSMPGLDPAASQ